MFRYAFLSLLTFLFFQNIRAQDGVIYLENPSFEGRPQAGNVGLFPLDGWSDCGFVRETPPDLHSNKSEFFGVRQKPFNGETYLGLVVRDNETWERMTQKLNDQLRGGINYEFKIHMCRSLTYKSPSRFSGELTNYTTPCKLRIWAGKGLCGRVEMLAESELVMNSDWEEYKFILTPSDNYDYITFEAFYKTPTPFPYNGNILIDDASPLIPVDENGNSIKLESVHDSTAMAQTEVKETESKKSKIDGNPLEFTHIFFDEKFEIAVFPNLDEEGNRQDSLAKKAKDIAVERAVEIERNLERDLDLLREKAETNEAHVPGDDLWFILNFAMETRHKTEGTFDVTMGELEKLWKATTAERKKPKDKDIKNLRRTSGMSQIEIDKEGSIKLLRSKLPIDIQALARAYTLDRMADALYEAGLKGYFLKSGDMAVAGEITETTKKNWKYQRPVYLEGTRMVQETPIWNSAIATTQPTPLFEKYGDTFYDMVDPVTGEVIRHASIVTVEAASAMHAYAWAKSLTINYDEKFYQWVKMQDTRVWYSEPY